MFDPCSVLRLPEKLLDERLPFQYESFEDASAEIRLILIRPSSSYPDLLEVELSHHGANAKQEYFALSYTWNRPSLELPLQWDDPSYTVPFFVDGRRSNIRPNLYWALREFRKYPSGTSTKLWADAICIDQSNPREKASQVQRMGEIYSQSLGALVWLGPDNGSIARAFQNLKQLRQQWDKKSALEDGEGSITKQARDYVTSTIDHMKLLDATEVDWDALLSLCQRSWWTRAWVAQEYVLAPFGLLISTGCTLERHLCGGMMTILSSFSSTTVLGNEDLKSKLVQLQLLARPVSALGRLHNSVQRQQDIGHLDLLSALEQLRQSNASDLRDKVYAARALSSEGDTLVVDYLASPQQVYARAAVHCISCSMQLSVLGHCNYPPVMPGLPTWAVDWSHKPSSRWTIPKRGWTFREQPSQSQFYTAGGHEALLAFHHRENEGILQIRGCILDTLAVVAHAETLAKQREQQPWDPPAEIEQVDGRRKPLFATRTRSEGHSACLRHWVESWQESTQYPLINRHGWVYDPEVPDEQFRRWQYGETKDSVFVAYARTVMMDCLGSHSSWELRRIKDWGDALPKDGQPLNECSRTFAVSQHGYFALVPEETEPGDSLVIFQGSEVPFVLRQKDRGFEVIGECYVHGVMDGECCTKLDTKSTWSMIDLV